MLSSLTTNTRGHLATTINSWITAYNNCSSDLHHLNNQSVPQQNHVSVLNYLYSHWHYNINIIQW